MKKLEKKDKIELAITVILIMVFIVLSFLFYKKRGLRAVPLSVPQQAVSADHGFKYVSQRDKGFAFLWERGMGNKESKRNPFLFGSANTDQTTPLSGLSLKGIIWDLNRPSAVINGQTFGIGDVIGDYKVAQITQDRVILESKTTRLELKLSQ
jgi:type II secretory pathway component PulC